MQHAKATKIGLVLGSEGARGYAHIGMTQEPLFIRLFFCYKLAKIINFSHSNRGENIHKLPLETFSIQKIRERYFESQLLSLREYILANLITK